MKDNLKEPLGCGLSKIWFFKCRFDPCCINHDIDYDLHNNKQGTKSLKHVDNDFLLCMLTKCENKKHKAAAYCLHGMAHTYGLIFWKGKR